MGSKLNLACWNSRGMTTAVPYLRQLMETNDIIAVNEHWLHKNRLVFLELISENFLYHAIASNAAGAENFGLKRGQGGVALFWRRGIKGISPITSIQHDRICGIRLNSPSHGLMVILSVYLPDSSSRDNFDMCLEQLFSIVDSMDDGARVIILGDFNADLGNLFKRVGSKGPNKRGRALF